jgi:hypothetical protein
MLMHLALPVSAVTLWSMEYVNRMAINAIKLIVKATAYNALPISNSLKATVLQLVAVRTVYLPMYASLACPVMCSMGKSAS